MSCDCNKGAVMPGCPRHSVADRVSPPASYEERIRLLTDAMREARDELGIPSDDYPAPVANAYNILTDALVQLGEQP